MTKLLATAAALALTAGAAGAATVFSEDFDGEAQELNASLDQFAVTGGSVDVIGPGFYDFFPGNGNYVDLNGSSGNGEPGTIEASASTLGLTVGQTYTLSFDYAFNTNSGNNEVLGFAVGDLSGTLDLNSQPASFQTYTNTFLYTGGSLVFADAGTTPGDFGGPVIDNIAISAVPLPAAGLMLLGALGALGLRRRRAA